jgi:anti-sigma B factor antagonist
MSMNYAERQIGDVTVLDLSGRIVLCDTVVFGPGAPHLLHDLVREQAKQGHKKILLNLRGIDYVDSSGLGELVSALSSVLNNGGQLRFCDANERVHDLLLVTHLDGVLYFSTDEAAAIEAFSDSCDDQASVA